jgi:hypothetical protein
VFSAAYVTARGQLREARGKRPLAFHGRNLVPLDADELIRLPEGSVVSMLPDRVALASGTTLSGAPAAALLPIGYTRTLLPAYERGNLDFGIRNLEKPARGEMLPLYGYTAVAMRDGEPYVAAMPTDDPRPWQHPDPGYKRLRRLIGDRLAEDKSASTAAPNPHPNSKFQIPNSLPSSQFQIPNSHPNSLLRHLAHCALSYECRSAQHIFYREGEGALPSSPTCNAACVGCISEQPDPDIQPHQRLAFIPHIYESVDLAVEHLERASNAIISFGQGCEGEPLNNSRNVEVIQRIRRRTSRGTININTNGSRPAMLRRMIDAGLGSIRVSMFSARDDVFRRYYRPVGYSLDDVRECLTAVSQRGLFTSVNLLTFPGITDDVSEVEALVELLTSTGTELVQLRNLNIDPEQLFGAMDGLEFAPIGIRAMASRFKQAGLAVGSYTHRRV